MEADDKSATLRWQAWSAGRTHGETASTGGLEAAAQAAKQCCWSNMLRIVQQGREGDNCTALQARSFMSAPLQAQPAMSGRSRGKRPRPCQSERPDGPLPRQDRDNLDRGRSLPGTGKLLAVHHIHHAWFARRGYSLGHRPADGCTSCMICSVLTRLWRDSARALAGYELQHAPASMLIPCFKSFLSGNAGRMCLPPLGCSAWSFLNGAGQCLGWPGADRQPCWLRPRCARCQKWCSA